MTGLAELEARGWMRFPADARTLAWAGRARETGREVAADPDMQATWLQCEGTWFVGVDALPSLPDGSVGGVPLAGPAIDALGPLPDLHPAQLSITYPGYPRPRTGENAASFRYRQNRDAAHVDGVIASGPDRRRRITEPHAWILGISLTEAAPGASPLVVWEGSHLLLRDAFRAALAEVPPDDWAETDVTDVYQATRRRCFEECTRRPLPVQPGEALLLHRLTLHGIAPWQDGALADPEGRMVAYFRPPIAGGIAAWLGP